MTGPLFTGPLADPRRYRIEVVGDGPVAVTGGEGLVFEATSTDGRRYALKLLTTVAPDDYGRLVERYEGLAGLDHPHLMRHVEVFLGAAFLPITQAPSPEDFDVIFTVAEWIDGAPISQLIEGSDAPQRLEWLGDVARAARQLHSHEAPGAPDGIVHRDIKPSNVRIDGDGKAVLIDFGIARPNTDDEFTRGAGTFNWQAPEVLTGTDAPGPAADTWAIGALGYWMLTGQPPRLEGRGPARERLRSAARELEVGDAVGLANHLSWPLESSAHDRPQDLGRWASELDAIIKRRRTPYSHRPRVRVAAALAVGLPLLGVAGTTGVDRFSGTPETQVLGNTIERISIEDPLEVPCHGAAVAIPGFGAEPGEQVRYTVADADEAPERAEVVVGTGPNPEEDIPNQRPAVSGTLAAGEVQLIPPLVIERDPVVRSNVSADSNGAFVLEWRCTHVELGEDFVLRYASDSGDQGQVKVVPIDAVTGLIPVVIDEEPDGRIHVDPGPPQFIDVSVEVEGGVLPDSAVLGLDTATVESSDPSVVSVEIVEPAPDNPFGLPRVKFTPIRPGEATVTGRLRDHVLEYDITVNTVET